MILVGIRISATSKRGQHAGGRPVKGNHLLTGGLLRCWCGAAMRARTEPKNYGIWEAYLCNGRHSGSTSCTMPALSREEIDRAVWHYFESVGLDYDAAALEVDLASGDWYIVPSVRADAILAPLVIGRDDHNRRRSRKPKKCAASPVQAAENSKRRHGQL
jgi:Recombinase zinc beta ribbon domain